MQDPDRYLLAVAAAFPDLGTSRKGAIEIAIAAIEGYVVGPNRKPGWGRGLGMLYDEYAMRPGRRAATIGNRERELRRKMKRAANDPVAARWLATMSMGVLLALWHVAPRGGNVGELIRELAARVGEQAFAENVLIKLWKLEGLRRIEAGCRAAKIIGADDYLPPDFLGKM